MTPLRVAVFIDAADYGGAERVALALLTGLDRDRWTPTLVHHGAPGLAELLSEVERLGIGQLVLPPLPEGLVGARRVPAVVERCAAASSTCSTPS